MFPPFERWRGGKKFYPVLRGVQRVSDSKFSNFVAPHTPGKEEPRGPL